MQITGSIVSDVETGTSAEFGDTFRFALRPQTLLVQRIIELTKNFETATGRDLGINSTDMAALGEVMMSGPQNPTEIARRLQISTAAMTAVVDRLETAGHVTRESNPSDRRGILIVPTPESVQRALSTLMPIARAIDESLDEFDESERAIIQRYLESIVARHERVLPPLE